MKFRQLTLILVATIAFVGVSFAQQSKSDESVEFRPHWSLQVQGGAAYTLGETNFGKRLVMYSNIPTPISLSQEQL